MKSFLFFTVGLFLLVQAGSCQSKASSSSVATTQNTQNGAKISAETFKKRAAEAGVQIIDVRTPQEFAGGYIVGAKNININDPAFQSKIAALDKNKPVLVYCAVGGRSGKAAATLVNLGFTDVSDLSGGYTHWPYK